jgi:ADP-ribosyl-[dinitrogen reductase] hydrolase
LVVGKSFKSAIEWIIFQKGDTDTNACIMGGLLGSLYGLKKLEMDAQIGVIKAWTSKRRPEWLHPGKVIPVFVEMLASRCPGELKVVGGSADYPPQGKK